MEPAIRVTSGNASRRSGDSFRLPGRRNERRDHIAIPITKGDHLVAFDFLVPVEADIVTTPLRRCGRAVAVDDRDVKELRLMERQHRALEDRIETAIRHPTAKRPPDTDVVDLPAPGRVLFDGQFLPLATEVQ